MATSNRIIRQLYFLIISIVTLTMATISLGYLIYTGLESSFLAGDTALFKRESPPMFTLPSSIERQTKNEAVDSMSQSLACTDECEFSDDDKVALAEWEASYDEWKSQKFGSGRARGMVNALSFLVVAAPLFFIHFRLLRKEYKTASEASQPTAVFSTYFYVVALAALIVAVVFAAMLLNSALRTWVIPEASQSGGSSVMTVSDDPYTNAGVNSVIACKDACGFSDEQVARAEQWKTDNREYSKSFEDLYDGWQVNFARSIAALIVALPIFWYHWTTIRKRKHEEQ